MLIDYSTNTIVKCIVGDTGPNGATFGEVSISAIWNVGYPNHMTANSGISGKFTIIVYPNTKVPLDWDMPIQPQIESQWRW